MLEKIINNQEKIQDDIISIKEEVAILSYDQNCVDVSKDIKFEYFANTRNINNVL